MFILSPAVVTICIYHPIHSPMNKKPAYSTKSESFVRAGALGLPLMVAIIGGETAQFRPLIDLYLEAGRRELLFNQIIDHFDI